MARIWLGFILLVAVGCSNPIEDVLQSNSKNITTVMDSLPQYEVQILFTEIDSTDNGIKFTDHSFQSDKNTYFYPASTVKLPVALLAAEYVSNNPKLHLDTPYSIQGDSVSHTVADDIRQLFAVSDNEAYNRLYEFLGRDLINERLRLKGLKNTRISHRLSTPNATDQNRKELQFYPSYESPTFIPESLPDSDLIPLELKALSKGNGFIQNGSLIEAPMDFSLKNYFSLQNQHDLMKQFFFPEEFNENKHFKIGPLERIRVKKAMAVLPKNAGYNSNTYYDSYGKFFIYGDSTEPIPEHIKIYNKVGYAYGTLTETAYIVDEKENVQFLLSATILVNRNGIFNDDIYEYEEIGIPFLAQLGRGFYEYVLANKAEDL